MTDKKHEGTDSLEALFETARAAPPPVPDALMQRVLGDAAEMQPRASRSVQQGLFRRIFEMVGGGPGMGGLITATCVGFWLGIAPPAGVPDVAGSLLGVEDTVLADVDSDALGGFGWDLGEGELDG